MVTFFEMKCAPAFSSLFFQDDRLGEVLKVGVLEECWVLESEAEEAKANRSALVFS